METATAYCSQCEHRLGSLLNLWTQIGKKYISPVVQTALALDISSEGVIRQGDIGTVVDGWYDLNYHHHYERLTNRSLVKLCSESSVQSMSFSIGL